MFSGKDNTPPTVIDCSLKTSTRTLGVILSFKCGTHTHTLDTEWHKYGSRLRARGKTELFSEIKHKNTRRNTVFLSATHTHTL